MRKRKRKLIRTIVISLFILALVLAAAIYIYRFFSDRKETLGEDTFVFAVLEKDEDNIEHINNLFLIDIPARKSKEIQVISIPPDLKCEVPGVSIDRIGDLYPFGGGNLITASISEKLGLNIGYYIIISENYFKSILDSISPVEVSLVEDINIDEFSFIQGDVALSSDQIEFLLNYDYISDYYREAQESKLYIIKEILSHLSDKKINLFNYQDSSGIETNISSSYTDLINSNFLDTSVEIYYDYLGENNIEEASKELRGIVLSDDYSNIDLPGIKKYYEEPTVQEEKPVLEGEEESVETKEVEITEESKEETLTREDLQIQLLNGNYIPGSATATSQRLEELGYTNFDIGNVEGGEVYDNSIIYFKSGLGDFAGEIGHHLGIDESFIQNFEDEATSNFDILIIVGLDFREE